jgi:AcrR family transcriptional regulator
MATTFTGAGRTARSMALLWRAPESSAARRGPRSSLDVDRIVAAAVRLADAEGLQAVSMRRLAAELGAPAMTLYSHVPGKVELVDLMLDAVLGELYPDEQEPTAGNWRSRIEGVARANREFFVRHPWALELPSGRPLPGPNLMRKYEIELRAIDGFGLSEVQMDLLATLVNGFVRGMAGARDQDGGQAAIEAQTAQIFDTGRYPTAARVGPAAGGRPGGAGESFEFALERLLDGIGVLILNPSR